MSTIDLSPLMPLVDQHFTRNVLRQAIALKAPAPQPDQIIAGYLGNLRFIVGVDLDGQVEASLSLFYGRPTLAQQEAFWRRWGIWPDYKKPTVILNGRGLHFVVRKAMRHA